MRIFPFLFKIFEALTFDERSEYIIYFIEMQNETFIYDLYLTLGMGRRRGWKKKYRHKYFFPNLILEKFLSNRNMPQIRRYCR